MGWNIESILINTKFNVQIEPDSFSSITITRCTGVFLVRSLFLWRHLRGSLNKIVPSNYKSVRDKRIRKLLRPGLYLTWAATWSRSKQKRGVSFIERSHKRRINKQGNRDLVLTSHTKKIQFVSTSQTFTGVGFFGSQLPTNQLGRNSFQPSEICEK